MKIFRLEIQKKLQRNTKQNYREIQSNKSEKSVCDWTATREDVRTCLLHCRMMSPLEYILIVLAFSTFLLFFIQDSISRCGQEGNARGFFQGLTVMLFLVGWVFILLNVVYLTINVYPTYTYLYANLCLVLAVLLFLNLSLHIKTVANCQSTASSRKSSNSSSLSTDSSAASAKVEISRGALEEIAAFERFMEDYWPCNAEDPAADAAEDDGDLVEVVVIP